MRICRKYCTVAESTGFDIRAELKLQLLLLDHAILGELFNSFAFFFPPHLTFSSISSGSNIPTFITFLFSFA